MKTLNITPQGFEEKHFVRTFSLKTKDGNPVFRRKRIKVKSKSNSTFLN